MNVTLREIVEARDALMTLSQQKMNIKMSYNVGKMLRKINIELDELNKKRQAIISENLKEGDTMTPEINQAIMSKLNIELEKEVEIAVHKVDLSNMNNIELSPRDVMALDPFCIFDSVVLE